MSKFKTRICNREKSKGKKTYQNFHFRFSFAVTLGSYWWLGIDCLRRNMHWAILYILPQRRFSHRIVHIWGQTGKQQKQENHREHVLKTKANFLFCQTLYFSLTFTFSLPSRPLMIQCKYQRFIAILGKFMQKKVTPKRKRHVCKIGIAMRNVNFTIVDILSF